MMASMLDTYTQGLAALKKRYSSADQAGQTDIQKEGLQYRQKALSDGVDLNQLEDATNKFMNPNYNATTAGADPYEQNYRANLFKQVTSAPKMGAMPTVSPVTPAATTNKFYDKTTTQLENIDQKLKTPYVYNPDTDPLVAGAKANADKRSKLATNSMMEDMNNRGILNSTVTSDRATDIRLKNEDQVTAMLPQFAQMGYSNNQQQLNNQFGLASAYKGMGDQEMQNTFSESALTGKYMQPGLQELYDKVIQAKKIAENPNATSAQINEAKMTADALRSQISQLGGDPNLVGYENDANQAATAVGQSAGLTLPAQTAKLNAIMGVGNNYTSLPSGTGNLVSDLPMFKDIGGYVRGLEGKETAQGIQLGISAMNANRLSAGAKDKPMSYTETQQRSSVDIINGIVSKATDKRTALDFLNDPKTMKLIVDEGVDVGTIKKGIEDYYGKDAAKPVRGLTESQVADKALQSAKTDPNYLAGNAEEQKAVLDQWKDYWRKNPTGGAAQ